MSKKTSTLLAAALAAPLLTTSVFAVDVALINGDMDTNGGVFQGLASGNDVNPETRISSLNFDGWNNYGYAGGTSSRLWDPSAINGLAGGNGTSWYDTSWGGNDASGNAEGQVLAIHTMQYDYRPAGAWFDDNGNRIWNMTDGQNTTDGSNVRVEFRALHGGTPSGGTGTVLDPYTYAADATPPAWTGTASVGSTSAAQLLVEAFDATAKYTLTVQVGRLAANGYNEVNNITDPGPDLTYGTGDDVLAANNRFTNTVTYDNWAGYEVELLAGELLYGEYGGTGSWLAGGDSIALDDNGQAIAVDSWGTSTITYTPGVSGDFSALDGQELAIRLGTKEDPGNHQNTMAAAFDNVVLTKIFAGDANEDDFVNGTDANIWRANFGSTTGNWNTADFTGDGNVGGADLNLWRANFGIAPSAAEAVSTVESLALAVIGDNTADFFYDPTTGELSVSADGESIWSMNFTTDENASATNLPTALWSFADFGGSLEWTDQFAGAFPLTADGFVLGTLATGLTAEDFGQVTYFTTASFETNFGTVEIVPEPSSLALLGLGGLLLARRRRA